MSMRSALQPRAGRRALAEAEDFDVPRGQLVEVHVLDLGQREAERRGNVGR
jgi:hypothetical protein